MAHAATRPPMPMTMSSQTSVPARHNEYFIDRDGIDREVITADICRYLGNDALVRPGVYEDPATGESRHGYFITAYRNLTSAMIEDLKNDSARWEQERANIAARTNTTRSPVHMNGNGSFYPNNVPNGSGPGGRSSSPQTNIIAPAPQPQIQPNGYQPGPGPYSQRPDMPINDYGDRRDIHDNGSRYQGHPQPYPGSVPPQGSYNPSPQNTFKVPGDSPYPGGYSPGSIPPYSAPPMQSPYGGPPPPVMPEYGGQQPYVSTGANLQTAPYAHERAGAAAPPPQTVYPAGQPPNFPPGPGGYPYPPPGPPGGGAPHYEPMKQPMDPMFGRGGYQDRANSPPVSQGSISVAGSNAGPNGDRQAPIPTKSPQGYPHAQYADNRGPYAQPGRG